MSPSVEDGEHEGMEAALREDFGFARSPGIHRECRIWDAYERMIGLEGRNLAGRRDAPRAVEVVGTDDKK
jgi:hypothetical protein